MRPVTLPRETPHPSEKALSVAVVKRWQSPRGWGGNVLNVHGGTTAQRGGEPDLLGCIEGRFVACELKQPGKVPDPRQYKRLRDWAAAGALAFWCTTEAEFDAVLEAHLHDLDWQNPQLERDAA